jgi:hypothetical protein
MSGLAVSIRNVFKAFFGNVCNIMQRLLKTLSISISNYRFYWEISQLYILTYYCPRGLKSQFVVYPHCDFCKFRKNNLAGCEKYTVRAFHESSHMFLTSITNAIVLSCKSPLLCRNSSIATHTRNSTVYTVAMIEATRGKSCTVQYSTNTAPQKTYNNSNEKYSRQLRIRNVT